MSFILSGNCCSNKMDFYSLCLSLKAVLSSGTHEERRKSISEKGMESFESTLVAHMCTLKQA